jgi:ribonuclease E
VERKIKEAMRHDRARIQLGRISLFGLLEMSRQRLRPSLIEASTQPCPHCNGTGHIRSTESTALHVLRAIEEEGMRRRSAEISVAAPPAVALYILNHKRGSLVQAEARCGFRVTIGEDDTLVPPAFRLERLRALTPAEIAALPAPVAPVAEPDEDEDVIEDEDVEIEAEARTEVDAEPPAPATVPDNADMPRPERPAGDDGHGRRRRRRRRRGRREDGREGAPHEGAPSEALPREGMPMMPPPLHDVTAPLGDLADDEGEELETEPEHQGGGAPPHPHAAEHNGEQGGRKRRRRGRRGGRRRRRNGEPGPEGLSTPADHHAASAPIAEQVEYVPPPPRDDAARDMEAALEAAPAPVAQEFDTESVPVIDRGDRAPAPVPPPPQPASEPPRHVSSTPLPAHEVAGPPGNPKRGWWRRVIDS